MDTLWIIPLVIAVIGIILSIIFSIKLKPIRAKSAKKALVYSVYIISAIAAIITIIVFFTGKNTIFDFFRNDEKVVETTEQKEELPLNDEKVVEATEQKEELYKIIGSYKELENLTGIYVSRDYAYVSDYTKGFSIIDIADKTKPILVSNLEVELPQDVYVKDDYAYIVGGIFNVYLEDNNANAATKEIFKVYLMIIDISKKTSPEIISTYYYDNDVNKSFLDYEYKYKLNKNITKSYYEPKRIFVEGNYAYIADVMGIEIIDITNKNNPKLISSLITNYEAQSIYVENEKAYIADGQDGILKIDISNKNSPEIIEMIDTDGYARDLYVGEDFIYVADTYNGISIINKSKMKEKFIYKNVGRVDRISKADDYFFLESSSGIKIIKIDYIDSSDSFNINRLI